MVDWKGKWNFRENLGCGSLLPNNSDVSKDEKETTRKEKAGLVYFLQSLNDVGFLLDVLMKEKMLGQNTFVDCKDTLQMEKRDEE